VGKEGLASFTSAMLDRGTQKRASEQIAEAFEQIGSGFGVDVDADMISFSASSLSFDKDTVLSLFSEVLLKPTFPHVEIEKLRKLTLAAIQKFGDRPESFSGFVFPSFLFGKHPYGHESVGYPKTVRAFKKVDLQGFYRRHFVPGNAVMAVTGQFDDAWKTKLVKTFSAWPAKTSKPLAALPAFPAWEGTELLLVNRADLNQAQVQIGFKGVPRKTTDYLELRAGLKILGESFGSRLFEEIRVKRGLTYGIGAWFDPREVEGPMGISTSTRVEKVGEIIDETLKTYRGFIKDGVTDSEVAEAKALMKGQFPRNFETAESLAHQLLILERYGISPDYLSNYMANVDGLSKDKINAAIKRFFSPQNLKIFVYAPSSKAKEALSQFGKVEVKEYKEYLQ
jgi:predicted Zn-dependent peptidase